MSELNKILYVEDEPDIQAGLGLLDLLFLGLDFPVKAIQFPKQKDNQYQQEEAPSHHQGGDPLHHREESLVDGREGHGCTSCKD